MTGSDSSAVQLLSLWASPFVMRAELALAFKQVEYEKVPQDLSNKSELLLQSNPVYKKVPVLLHHGKPVCESSIIVQYVDEAFPSPDGVNNLLPSDPYDRAICRFWADYVDKKLFDALFGLMRSKAEDQKAGIENVMAVLATLEEALGSVPKEPPFFGGAAVGYVDIMMGPLLVWLSVFDAIANVTFVAEDRFPRLSAWISHFQALPIAAGLPESSKLVDFVFTFILKRPPT